MFLMKEPQRMIKQPVQPQNFQMREGVRGLVARFRQVNTSSDCLSLQKKMYPSSRQVSAMLVVIMTLLTAVRTSVIVLHAEPILVRQDAVPHYLPEMPIPPDGPQDPGIPWPHSRERTHIFDPYCDPTGWNLKPSANSGRVHTHASVQDSIGQASQNPSGKISKGIVMIPGVTWSKNVDGRVYKDALVQVSPEQASKTPSGYRTSSKSIRRTAGVTWSTQVSDGGHADENASVHVGAGSASWRPGGSFKQGSHDVSRMSGVPWRRTVVDGGRFPGSTGNIAMGTKHFDFSTNPMADSIGNVFPFNRPMLEPGAPKPGLVLFRHHHFHGQWPGHSHVHEHSSGLGRQRSSQASQPSPLTLKRLLVTPKPTTGVLSLLVGQFHQTSATADKPIAGETRPTGASTLSTTTNDSMITNKHSLTEKTDMSTHPLIASGKSNNDRTHTMSNKGYRNVHDSNGGQRTVENVSVVTASGFVRTPQQSMSDVKTQGLNPASRGNGPLKKHSLWEFGLPRSTFRKDGNFERQSTSKTIDSASRNIFSQTTLRKSLLDATQGGNINMALSTTDTVMPLKISSATPFEVSNITPFDVTTATTFEVRTAKPLEVNNATPFKVRTATSPEVSTAAPFEVRTATLFEASTVQNSALSTGLPSATRTDGSSVMAPTADVHDVESRQFEGFVVGSSGTLASNTLLHERLHSQWHSLGQRMHQIASQINGGGAGTQQTR
ncbi:uncharacterized protein LOC124111486 [Haliotis rufescens]|uniref:uncharacterized protein LOC124111486 n=1 Tax=Haliotis rufescens TaxID=6454 RepID=UPI00201F162F|nr:uncharacterized protein LOC124111486 [Haliotis rufescens]XP_046327163.2 uncharacterized protein LOC124111486 [Haliotis rufescens]